jgi:hypothetical protein
VNDVVDAPKIVAKVDQLMALVDQLETQLAASRATAAILMEALVAELHYAMLILSLPAGMKGCAGQGRIVGGRYQSN